MNRVDYHDIKINNHRVALITNIIIYKINLCLDLKDALKIYKIEIRKLYKLKNRVWCMMHLSRILTII